MSHSSDPKTAPDPLAAQSALGSCSQLRQSPRRPFLTAEWRHLAVLNFEIDPAVLQPLVPRGTELDFFGARTFVSLVGFVFRDTRVRGIAVRGHRNFEEINLRFYVRRKTETGWRRAVVFIKEVVPRPLVAWTARLLYRENYVTAPTRHHVEHLASEPDAPTRVSYAWTYGGRAYQLELTAAGPEYPAAPDSLDEFIIEHYWGYSGRPGRATIEYRVDHPRWTLRAARTAGFAGDAAFLYGPRFVEPLGASPASAFYADGSPVAVFPGVRI